MATESFGYGVDTTDTESQASTVSCSGAEFSTDVNCDSAGCKDFTVPNQPVDVSESKKTHRHQSKEKWKALKCKPLAQIMQYMHETLDKLMDKM